MFFETKTLMGCNSMEDADYLSLLQRHPSDSGGMLRRSVCSTLAYPNDLVVFMS
jgi:hypothetical protein